MSIEKAQRSFPIGDEWLYYKIYTGPKTADKILIDTIQPISKELIEERIIDKWFFIRYADPQYHLRIRFHATDIEHIGCIIRRLLNPLRKLMNMDLIWKIQADTYQRELNRYGTETILVSEDFFFHDSEMIVKFLNLIHGDEGEQLRWLFALRAINSLLDSFSYSITDKFVLLEKLKNNFGEEFGMSRSLKKQLDAKYRTERDKIETFILLKKEDITEYVPLIDILDEKQQNIRSIGSEILYRHRHNTLEMKINDLMASYIHMLMNRLFTSKNRLHELVCYDFLYRFYRSTIAREKNNKLQRVKS